MTWLREFIDTDATAETIAGNLTMAGMEVASLEDVVPEVEGVVAARVLKVENPDQDLLVVTVRHGEGNCRVVAGAKVGVGQVVPLALPGARLPRGRVIREASLGGVRSQGMLCSASELLLGEEHREGEGILILEGADPGQDVLEFLGWKDQVMDLDLTPNYAHCLSLLGVAREVLVTSGGRLRYRPRKPRESGGPIHGRVTVDILDPGLCPRYSARLLEGVTIAPSPHWMQYRLWASGIRPIDNVVDVTNYVMLELGQPLHAFDFHRLREPAIIVRTARPGERLLTLDGQDRPLDEGMLVIADPLGPVALAGVMGGEDTAVVPGTRCVLLESAAFDARTTGMTSRGLGLRSEASSRFEKGTDVQGTVRALDRAAVLLEGMRAATAAPGVVDEYPGKVEPRVITLRPQRVNEILGTSMPARDFSRILKGLGFGVAREGKVYQVKVPTWRVDVAEEVDLVEEVARIHGYGAIPTTMPQGPSTSGWQPRERAMEGTARDILVSLGLTEVNTYAFSYPGVFDRVRLDPGDPLRNAIALANPLREDQSIMRTILLPSLLEVLEANARRGVEGISVFEVSRVYRPLEGFPEGLPGEFTVLAVACTGNPRARAWRQRDAQWDFYALKGMLEVLLSRLGLETLWEPSAHPSYAGGRQARLSWEGKSLGYAGEAHPAVREAYGLEAPVFMAEIDFEALRGKAGFTPRYVPVPRYPAVRRDISVIVPEGFPAEEVARAARLAAGELLEDMVLFDVYDQDPIPAGHRSLAYSLTYRSRERTLTDPEVDAVQGKVRKALAGMGLSLR
jgi:phenylalanyl-tRNA synthetase beta chain